MTLKWVRATSAAALVGVLHAHAAFAQELPQLDPEREIVCVERDDGVILRMQCDDEAKRCLVAEAKLDTGAEAPTLIPRQLNPCSQAEPGALARLEAAGYEMVEARHEAPFGFKRDERGRLFQTHFDLRRRYFLGVGDVGFVDALEDVTAVSQSVYFEVGGSYEEYDGYRTRRNRFRFLEGTLQLTPLEIEGLLFQYDRGRQTIYPTLWITTFVGEPRRYDINLDVGPGVILGRFWYGPIGSRQMGYVDVAAGHLNWEMFQTANLEDYFLVRLGAGLGVRFFGDDAAADVYLYPELGVEWAWLMGQRGLTELRLQGTARLAHEPVNDATWYEMRGAVALERILLAITDQPIALFIEPSAHYIEVPFDEERRADVRVMAGGRLSFFVPAREPDDRCPNEAEDYDGFQDSDGCFDPDNDSDGIEDLQDSCPLEPEDLDGVMDGDGCPDY